MIYLFFIVLYICFIVLFCFINCATAGIALLQYLKLPGENISTTRGRQQRQGVTVGKTPACIINIAMCCVTHESKQIIIQTQQWNTCIVQVRLVSKLHMNCMYDLFFIFLFWSAYFFCIFLFLYLFILFICCATAGIPLLQYLKWQENMSTTRGRQ